jgi:hypothetical protein
MLVTALRQLLLALTAFAFLGGTTVQAMPFVQPDGAAKPAMAMTASGDCDQMDMSTHDSSAKTSMPCKSMTVDCLLKMGCSASAVSFAATSYIQPVPIAYSTVSYSRFFAARTGRSLTPDPFPPKTLA